MKIRDIKIDPSSSNSIYWRNEELVTQDEKMLLTKLYGTNIKTPYNFFTEHIFNHGYNTGLMQLINILSVIQNTRELNEREDAIMERIARSNGSLTKSKKDASVEHGLLYKLMLDGIDELNKFSDDKFEWHKLEWKEVQRIYGLPYESIAERAERHKEEFDAISKPSSDIEIEYHWPVSSEQMSGTKNYYIKKASIGSGYGKIYSNGSLYSKFPYLKKVHFVHGMDGYWQVYVRDYFYRNWAVRNVVEELRKIKD